MPTAINHGTNNDQNIIVQVDYDKGGRMVAMRDPNGQETTYEYDQLGRRTKLTNPRNQEWTTSYAETANGTQTTMNYPEANHSITRDFDLLGRLTGIQYGNRATTPDVDFTYDVAGNRTEMTETDDVGTARKTTYSYDNARRLTNVGFDEDGNGTVDETVAYDYDILGRRTSLTFDGQTVSYEYDARGRLVTLTDWDNQRTSFAFDGAGRHISTQRPNGMRSSYRHDRAGRLARLQHHKGLSKLAQFDYTVDGRGNRTQVIEMLRPANANYATRTFAYNHADISYKGSWSDAGQFKATDAWADSLALTVTGDELTLTYGTGPDHSIFDIYVGGTFYNSYDGYAASTGEETVTIHLDSDQRISFEIKNRHEQNLASSGFRVRFKNLQAKSKLTTQVIDYTYDGLSRLIEADYDNGTTVKTYGYDLAGNMTNMNGVTRTYNAANQMTHDGTNTLTYDNNGNLTNDGVNSYTWDRANRLVSHGGLSYAYDGLGNRISQDNGSVVTKYLLDTQPGLAVVLRESDGTNTNHYVHGIRGVHAQYDGSTWEYMMQDGLNSVRGLVDASGAVQQSVNYSEYGDPDTSLTGFAFTGEQRDTNGLQYHRARYYDPVLGIFPSLDPFEGIHDRPMSLNGYSWVEGNPVMNVDPTGMDSMCSSQPLPCPNANRFVQPPSTRSVIDRSYQNEQKPWFLRTTGEVLNAAHATEFLTWVALHAFSIGHRQAASNMFHWLDGTGSPITNYNVDEMLAELSRFQQDAYDQMLYATAAHAVGGYGNSSEIQPNCTAWSFHTHNPNHPRRWRRVGDGSDPKPISVIDRQIYPNIPEDTGNIINFLIPQGDEWDWYTAQGSFNYSVSVGVVHNSETDEFDVCYKVYIEDHYGWYKNDFTGGFDAQMHYWESIGVGKNFPISGNSSMVCSKFTREQLQNAPDTIHAQISQISQYPDFVTLVR